MSIQVLSDQLASQIAAGEVVERPGSVVKELVENSIDAGATAIQIEVRAGGRQLIQVADDGAGIPAEELELAFVRHATSKLATVDDLNAIGTLGFRGEALAAISAVSQVTVVSRQRDMATGKRLVLKAGEVVGSATAGAPAGTVIAIENLFYNVPARLKFLKTDTTEKRLIDEFVTRYALAYPHIRFRLTHDNRVTFQTTGSGNVQDVLLAIYGPDVARQLLAVGNPAAAGERSIRVSGFAAEPSVNRANRNHINLFVNGRWIRDHRLSYAVTQAYHTLLPGGRYPLALIFIDLPRDEVDVNVHPTKVEVRFRDEGALFAAVQRAVRETLVEATPVRDMGAWATADDLAGWGGARGAFERREQPEATQTTADLRWPTLAASPGNSPVPESGANGGEEAQLPVMRVVGQIGAAYVIAEGPEGMYLIDQHAAHERVLYEQFMAARERQEVASQGLVSGAAVYLSPSQATMLEANQEVLERLGFRVEPFGPNGFIIRAVPAIVARSDPAQALLAALTDLESEKSPLAEEVEAILVRRVCKTAAIKAGQTLSRPEMEALILQLEACDNPHTCPHGRPTMIHLSAATLARQFGRT